MKQIAKFAIVDADMQRRVNLCSQLAASGRSVEPYENTRELTQHWPHDKVLMIYDDGYSIGGVLDCMGAMESWNPVVAYCDAHTSERIVDAMLKGALDYLVWPTDHAGLPQRLDKIEARVGRFGEKERRATIAKHRISRLSPREREVLTGLTAGLSNKGIANSLDISHRTVEIHRANMMNRIEAKSSSEAIRFAIEADVHLRAV
ncbi:LuxR C-terminal-related transcriptional regulator [Sphingomonadaceae bacterium]|nr:LuxR C-terminal-related transcriptional regulator [Sphingomonadaceae bacterium]